MEDMILFEYVASSGYLDILIDGGVAVDSLASVDGGKDLVLMIDIN